jgi:hypothetical protein
MYAFMLLGYGANANETPSGTNSPANRHTFTFVGAYRSLELHLNNAALTSAGYNAHGCGSADIEHQGFAGVDGLDRRLVRDSNDTLQKPHIHGK